MADVSEYDSDSLITPGYFDYYDSKLRDIGLHHIDRDKHLNTTMDFSRPFLKPNLRYVYPLFAFFHGCLTLAGTIGNFALLIYLLRTRMYRNPTFFFLGNMALSDILKAAVVLPLTLTSLLFENWIFGSFLCYFSPMLHDFPTHATILSYTLMAIDRYRFIVYPMKARIPAGLCSIGVWIVSVCMTLPYAVFIQYLDLGSYNPHLNGYAICTVNVEHLNIEEYIRAMFVCLYCLPLAVITFLCVKVSVELKATESTAISLQREDAANASVSEATYQTQITWSERETDPSKPEAETNSYTSGRVKNDVSNGSEQEHEDEIDMRKEKRTQKYIIAMVILFAMCWFPMKILILVTHFVYETDDNSAHYDITYLTFAFFAYLSTCVNPVLFASWRMSDRTKNRLRGYFRFSNRRHSLGHTAMTIADGCQDRPVLAGGKHGHT